MEWLKKILEQAKVNEEGKIDIDAVMKLVNAEFPKHAVPKETTTVRLRNSKQLTTRSEISKSRTRVMRISKAR